MLKRDIVVGLIFLLVGGSAGIVYAAEQKVMICHATHSAKNPYVLITVAASALNGQDNAGDFIPAPGATDCTQTTPPPPPGVS